MPSRVFLNMYGIVNMKNQPHRSPFIRMRIVAWVNILFQLFFPMAVAFTPAMAGSELQSVTAPDMSQVQPYTLAAGETVDSVAKKYNLTTEQLRKLNQFRIFANGFDHLKGGDELDVPAAPASGKKEHDAGADRAQDATEQKVAGYASQAGNFLKNTHQGEAAASMARGMATGEAGGALQQWLSHFGTARVQLNADEKFSLKNSQFDLLVPWYERDDLVLLSQASLHRTDDRGQGNFGLGSRWFNDGWMVGANTFLDYDFSREHTRAGLGLEYWRDYLKLGANSYMRLSGWKDSPDVTDYEERPANGWDIRTQAWLPALPQLGGKLVFEQYYGDEVALFGKDNRQHNPHAVTAGVNYTPFPLLTLGAEQRQGGSGKNDTRLDVSLNFQPGVPWRQQLDPGAVGAMRSLMGSRYDLVDRNNNIILEYRKKDIIHLHTLDLVTGHPGEHKSLGVSVTSKYGLDHVEWSDASLVAAGGSVESDSAGGYNVVVPPYRAGAGAVNTYTLAGVAVDRKGNRSGESHTQVTVTTPPVDKNNSTFGPADSVLPADGSSRQVLTLTVMDGQKQPVDTPASNINITLTRSAGEKSTREAGTSSAVSEPVKKSTGVFEITVTAGKVSETLTLTPQVFGETLTPAKVLVSREIPYAATSAFFVESHDITAGDTGTTVTFKAKDVEGEVISGIADKLSLDVKDAGGATLPVGSVHVTALTENGSTGEYTATLTGTKAGDYTLVPAYGGMDISGFSEKVTIHASRELDVNKSTLNPQEKVIFAGGGDNHTTLRFEARDTWGNLIDGLTDASLNGGGLEFSSVVADDAALSSRKRSLAAGKNDALIDVENITETSPGIYTATVSGNIAGRYKIYPEITETSYEGLNASLTVLADYASMGGTSTFGATVYNFEAGGVTQLQLQARDAHGNGVVLLAAGDTQEKNLLQFRIADTDGKDPGTENVSLVSNVLESPPMSGLYTVDLKANLAGTFTVTPLVGGRDVNITPVTITVSAGDPDHDNTSGHTTAQAAPTEAQADGNEAIKMTLFMADRQGNGVPAAADKLSLKIVHASGDTAGKGELTLSGVTEDAQKPGTYNVTVQGTRADRYTATFMYNGKDLAGGTAGFTLKAGSTPSMAPGASEIESDDASIASDNIQQSTVTLHVRDAQKNGISGLKDKLTFTITDDSGETVDPKNPSSGILLTPITEGSADNPDTAGSYVVKLSGTKAGDYIITPSLGGTPMSINTTVTLRAGAPDMTNAKGYSELKASPTSIQADNSASSLLTLFVADQNGNGVQDLDNRLDIVATDGKGENPNVNEVVMTGPNADAAHPGTYTWTLQGTLAGTYDLSVKVNGQPLNGVSASVTLTPDTHPSDAPGTSTFNADKYSIASDDSEKSVLTFVARDKFMNPLEGLTPEFVVKDKSGHLVTTTGPDVRLTPVMPDPGNKSAYTATLSGTLAGAYTITPKVDGTELSGIETSVTLEPGVPDLTNATGRSRVTTATDNQTANGSDKDELDLFVADKNGNGVPDLADDLEAIFTGSGSAPAFPAHHFTKGSDAGHYTLAVSSTVADTYGVTFRVGSASLTGVTGSFTLKADPVPATGSGKSRFEADPDGIPATGTTTTLTFEPVDNNGNPIKDLGNALKFLVHDKGGNDDSPENLGLTLSSITEVNGVYTAQLSGTQAGTFTFTPEVNGTKVNITATVTISADLNVAAANSTFTTTPSNGVIDADGLASLTMTFTPKDANDNPIKGITETQGVLYVEIKDSNGRTVDNGTDGVMWDDFTETAADSGIYKATLNGTRAGKYTITPYSLNNALTPLNTTVTLTAGDPVFTPGGASKTEFTAEKDEIDSDGVDDARLTLKLSDAQGNLLPGLGSTLSLDADGALGISPGTLNDNGDGTYTASLTATKAQVVTVTVMNNGNPTGLKATVTIRPGDVDGSSKATVYQLGDSSVTTLESGSTETLHYAPFDVNGNPVTNLGGRLTFVATPADGVDIDNSSITEKNGVYTVEVRGDKAHSAITIVPEVDNTAMDTPTPVSVAVTPGAPLVKGNILSTLSPVANKISTDGGRTKLELVLKDAQGNIIDDSEDKIGAVLTSGGSPATGVGTVSFTESPVKGTYDAELSGTMAQVLDIGVTFNHTPVQNLTTQVELTTGTPDYDNSSGSSRSSFLLGDAAAADVTAGGTVTATFSPTDANGNPVKNLKNVNVVSSNASAVNVSNVSENDGVYTAMVTGLKTGTFTLHPEVEGAPAGSLKASLTVKPGAPDAGSANSSFTVSTASMTTDDSATVTLKLVDANGNPGSYGVSATGVGMTLLPSTGATITGLAETAQKGTYTGTLKATKPDSYTITPTYNGTNLNGAGIAAKQVNVVAGAASGNSLLQLGGSGLSQTINAGESVNITFTALDAAGNAVSGLAPASGTKRLAFVTSGAGVTVGPVSESGKTGVYTAFITGKTAATYTIEPRVDGNKVGNNIATLTVKAGTVPKGGGTGGSQNDFTSFTASSPDVGVSDSAAQSITYTVILKDGQGNHLIDAQSKLKLVMVTGSMTNMTVSGFTQLPSDKGVYEATIYGKMAQSVTLKVQYNGTDIAGLNTITSKFIEGIPDPATSTIPGDQTLTEGAAPTTLTWTLKDKFGNPVTQARKVEVKDPATGNGDSQITVGPLSSTVPGVYTAPVTPTKAGDAVFLQLKVDGSTINGMVVTVTVKSAKPVDPVTGMLLGPLTPEQAADYCARMGLKLPSTSRMLDDAKAGVFVGLKGPIGTLDKDLNIVGRLSGGAWEMVYYKASQLPVTQGVMPSETSASTNRNYTMAFYCISN